MDAATSASPTRSERRRMAREPFERMNAARPTLGMPGAFSIPMKGDPERADSRRLEEVVPRSRYSWTCPITIPSFRRPPASTTRPTVSSHSRASGSSCGSATASALSSLVVGGAFLAVGVPLAVLPSSERSPSFLLIAALVAAYAVAVARAVRGRRRVRDPDAARARADALRRADRAGAAARRCSASSRGELPSNIRRGVPLERAIVVPASAWHAVGPAVVLLARRRGPGRAGRAGRSTLAALAAQFALRLRERLGPRVARLRHLAARAPALRGLGRAASTSRSRRSASWRRPRPASAATPSSRCCRWSACWSCSRAQRRLGIDHALELGQAYRGTAFLLGDMIEADDAYTGIAQPAGRRARRSRSRTSSASTPTPAATPSSRRCSTTSARSTSRTRSSTSAARSTTRSGRSCSRHTIDGEAMLARVGGLLGRVGAHRPRLARALRRQRLSRTASPARRSRSRRGSSRAATRSTR